MGIDAISGGYSAGMTAAEYDTYSKKQSAESRVSTQAETSKKAELNTGKPVVTMADGEQVTTDELKIQDVDPEKVKSAIAEVNQKIRPTRTQCEFSYHEDTKRIAIKVIDESTREVIREIPPEKTLDMIAKVMDLAGILVDEKR